MQCSILKNVLLSIILCLGYNNCYNQERPFDSTTIILNRTLTTSSINISLNHQKQTVSDTPCIIITQYQELEQATGQLIDKLSALKASNKIKIAPSTSAFTIHFSLVDKFYSSNNGFAYKIEGLENNWNEIKENHIRIYNLPYGSYILIIKGRRYNSEWTTNHLSIPVEVIKPYYLQWWFFTCIGLSIMGFCFLFFKNRLIRLEESKKALEKLVQLRTQKIQEDKILIEQQYKELETLNQTKDKLFTIIAHDLKDPANTFIGLSKKLRYLIKTQQWERLESFGEYIEQSAESLHKMLNNLLTWASTQQGSITSNKENFNLKSLIIELLPVYEIKAKEHGIFIDTNLSNTPLSLFADREMIAIILRNLLDNALKFSQKGDAIKINTFEQNKYVGISIQDEGIGIPSEMIPQLFSLKPEKVRRGIRGLKGAGLGLSICKELIELNDGRIIVKNRVPQGANMTLFFPSSLHPKQLLPVNTSFSEV